jgi:hypothetical protein
VRQRTYWRADIAPATAGAFDCSLVSVGYHRDPIDCNVYYYCSAERVRWKFACIRSDDNYSARTNECVRPGVLRECRPIDHMQWFCESTGVAGGVFAHPYTCDEGLFCRAQRAYRVVCPDGTRFERRARACRRMSTVRRLCELIATNNAD